MNAEGLTMINMTQSAVNAVRMAIDGAKDPIAGLRIMVEAGGCAGLKYKMGLVAETVQDDVEVEQYGVKIFIDPASVAFLEGTTVDFVIGMDGSGFVFDNPQAKSSCSCGKSFG
jgi:iron-sulfur cluster assembly accessory protein